MRECPECGFPFDHFWENHCPKCDGPTPHDIREGLLEVDVAHAGETWEHVREKIVVALNQAIHYRDAGLKIVHGHGSMSGHSIIGPRAMAFLSHLAGELEGRFASDRNNRGASIICLNR